jgi:hypothetical protein
LIKKNRSTKEKIETKPSKSYKLLDILFNPFILSSPLIILALHLYQGHFQSLLLNLALFAFVPFVFLLILAKGRFLSGMDLSNKRDKLVFYGLLSLLFLVFLFITNFSFAGRILFAFVIVLTVITFVWEPDDSAVFAGALLFLFIYGSLLFFILMFSLNYINLFYALLVLLPTASFIFGLIYYKVRYKKYSLLEIIMSLILGGSITAIIMGFFYYY